MARDGLMLSPVCARNLNNKITLYVSQSIGDGTRTRIASTGSYEFSFVFFFPPIVRVLRRVRERFGFDACEIRRPKNCVSESSRAVVCSRAITYLLISYYTTWTVATKFDLKSHVASRRKQTAATAVIIIIICTAYSVLACGRFTSLVKTVTIRNGLLSDLNIRFDPVRSKAYTRFTVFDKGFLL